MKKNGSSIITASALLLSAAVHGAVICGIARCGVPGDADRETRAAAAAKQEKYALLPDIEVVSGVRASVKPAMAKEEPAEKAEPFGTRAQENGAYEAQQAAAESFLYQDGVKRAIQEARKYPPQARREGEEGPAGVEFTVYSDGSVGGVTLFSSSGSAVLDDEALATIKRAAPYPRFTDGMRFDKLTMQFKIVFRLN